MSNQADDEKSFRVRAIYGSFKGHPGDMAVEIERLRSALAKIAAGDGYYGAQAHEYKNIAREALGEPHVH